MAEPDAVQDRPRQPGWTLAACEAAYTAAVAFAIFAVHVGGDRWGWATVAAYGPLALLAVPGGLLAAVIAWGRRRVPWLSVAALAATAVGVLDFNLPWRRAVVGRSTRGVVRVLELNANGGGTDEQPYDPRRLAELVRRASPDVLALAEWPDGAKLPPPPTGVPWQARRSHDVLLASRYPIGRSAEWSGGPLGGEGAVVGGEVVIDGRPVWCFAVHLETPRRGFEPVLQRLPGAARALSDSIARRRRLSLAAAAFVGRTAGGEDCLVAGDFNEVPDGAIFRDSWGDRADAFGRAGWGFGWTKWQDGWGVRIDHVRVGGGWAARRCWVGPDVGSDHLPLLAEVGPVAP